MSKYEHMGVKMNKEKVLKIIIIIAVIIVLIILGSLIYRNNKLKQEIDYLKYDNKDLQNKVLSQEEKIHSIELNMDEIDKFVNEQKERKKDEEDIYYKAVNSLDNTIFLTDFENYTPNNNEIQITEKKAKEIAQKGFEESKRIASEGTDDIDSETVKIEEVVANNYFTRYYHQGNEYYDKIKRKCYAVQRENDMGCGVTVYVDVTTGLIIAGRAFGD